ncbi:MAG: hypothetical protein LBH74_04980 [Nitrososphaerota archaeon]|jgi:hypothetical protein|nr:hypothetical protein [Nitrososphaerota archaeon]
MVREMLARTQQKLILALSDGKPQSSKMLTQTLKLSSDIVEAALGRMWRNNKIMRSKKPLLSTEQTFKGRAGKTTNLRQYYLYLIGPKNETRLFLQGQEFVAYDPKYLDKRGGAGKTSKTKCIREYLLQNRDRAHYSKHV